MIYITGATHADFNRFSIKNFSIQEKMRKDDYVIICGDFGGIWNYITENMYEQQWLNWLDSKSFTTFLLMEIMKTLKDYIDILQMNGMEEKYIK